MSAGALADFVLARLLEEEQTPDLFSEPTCQHNGWCP